MKVSKRSLIVSIAVLCVCALSLTAASFAWFSASTKTTVSNIDLKVNAESDLKISMDSIDKGYSNMNWQSNIVFDGSALILSDASTDDVKNFVVPADREKVVADGEDAGKNTGDYKAIEDDMAKLTIHFRSTKPVSILANTNAPFDVDNTKKQAINDAFRMAIETTVFGNNAITDNDVISGQTATFGQTSSIKVNKTTVATLTDVVLTEDTTDGYFYGTAVVTFWIEGTEPGAISANTGVDVPDMVLNFSAQ